MKIIEFFGIVLHGKNFHGKTKAQGKWFLGSIEHSEIGKISPKQVVVWKLLEDLDALAGTISLKVLLKGFSNSFFFTKWMEFGFCTLFAYSIFTINGMGLFFV